MTMGRWHWIALAGLTLIGGWLVYSAFAQSSIRATTSVMRSGDTPAPAVTQDHTRFSEPIYNEDSALTTALSEFTYFDAEPTGSVVRLINYEVLRSWSEAQLAGAAPDAPVWLVGISADGMTGSDFDSLVAAELGHESLDGSPVDGNGSSIASGPIEGVYFVYDANSGQSMGGGVLDMASSRSFASIVALTSVIATIVPATEPPPYPTIVPSGTSRPTAPGRSPPRRFGYRMTTTCW